MSADQPGNAHIVCAFENGLDLDHEGPLSGLRYSQPDDPTAFD
jgi:hypothetical protein